MSSIRPIVPLFLYYTMLKDFLDIIVVSGFAFLTLADSPNFAICTIYFSFSILSLFTVPVKALQLYRWL